MSDPTNAKEFRLPSGEIMWVDPAAAKAAKKETGPMANKSVGTVGDDNNLTEAPQDGLYQIGRGVFRYKRGDKMPAGAVRLEGKERPGLRDPKAKKSGGKKPDEDAKSTGPSETT